MLYDYDIINSSSVYAKPKIIEYILSLCDKVEFLMQHTMEKSFSNSFNEDFSIFNNALKNVYSGCSYGMDGKIYQFELTDEIKKFFIDRCDITLPINSMDNPAFLNGNKHIVSNCSHESIVNISPEYKKQIEDKYLSLVRKDPLYKQMQQKFLSVDKSNFRNEYNNLQNLPIYANWFNCYFVAHKVENCDYNKYLQIANKYFSKELLYHFNHTIDFKGLLFDNFKNKYYNELHYLEILASEQNMALDDNNYLFGSI